jgi:hypothetical protein
MDAEDRWLTAELLVLFATAYALIAYNARVLHYPGISYFPREMTPVLFPLAELGALGLWLRRKHPRAAFALGHLAAYGLLTCAISMLVTGLQYTPYPPIDARLAAFDAALGLRVTALMAWTYSLPPLAWAMKACYLGLNIELFALPALVILLGDRRRVRVFLSAGGLSFLAGGLFYWFHPSSGPATVLASPHFTSEQLMTSLKFRQLHAGIPPSAGYGGMIAFPSFHVVWAVLLAWTARADRRLWRAAGPFNALAVASTLLLGWHFLADVLGGLALAAASLWAAELLHARLSRAA